MALHDKNTISLRLDAYWDDINKVTEDIRTWHIYDNSDILRLLNSDSYFIPNIYQLALLSEDGAYYKSSGEIESKPELVEYCRKNPERHLIRGVSSEKALLIFICPITPFEADSHLFKYAFCSVLVSGLEKEFMIPSFQGEGWSCIVDGNGNFLVHIHKGQYFLNNSNLFDLFTNNQINNNITIENLKTKLRTNSDTFSLKAEINYESNGQDIKENSFILFSPVPRSDWIIVSVTPTSVFRNHTTNIMAIVLILLGLIVAAFISIVIFAVHKRQKQQSILSQMFDRFSQGFTSVYLVNAKDNSYKILKHTPYLSKKYPHESTFTTTIDSYIQKDVFPADQALVHKSTRQEYILERLKSENKFTIRYRDISNPENPLWYEMTATKVDAGNKVSYLLGFANNHDEVLEDFIREKMYDSYIAVYYVNLQKDSFKVLKYPITTDIIEVMADKPWSEAASAFVNACCDEESRSSMLESICDVNQIQNSLLREDMREYTYRWNYGEKVWRRLVVHAYERDNEKVTSVIISISIMDDLSSENQDLSRQLQSALEKAETANFAKTQFLNSMSHDIRTPMNAILGFTDIAKKHIDNKDKVLESLNKAHNACEHLLALINDVLEMSRIESGTVEVNLIESDFRRVENEIQPIFDSLAHEKNIDFTINLSGIQNPYVKLDRLRMNQIIINIVSNAIKYTNDGGKVTLTILQTASEKENCGKYIMIVEDNGIGMSKEFQNHLFETFSREQTATVSKKEGTGLGLAITKRLVDLMGGNIFVTSEKGIGSTFTVIFDLEIVEHSTIADQNENVSKKIENLKGKRILLVDDNDFNREIVHENLTDEGVIVEEATNGAEGLEKVHLAGSKYFDCVLMDIQMPVMNGYEAIKAIRALGPEFNTLPIIALSANAFEEDVEKSKEYGMCTHLSKPVRVNELLAALNKFAN